MTSTAPSTTFLESPYSIIKSAHSTSFNYKLAGMKRTYDSCSDDVCLPSITYSTSSPRVSRPGELMIFDPQDDEQTHRSDSKDSRGGGANGPGETYRDLNSCCVDGCDSSGNLNGLDERHCTLVSCPTYHNTDMAKCKVRLPVALPRPPKPKH